MHILAPTVINLCTIVEMSIIAGYDRQYDSYI